MTGYILALISSFFFGLYVVPRKLTNINPLHFSLLMSAGFFIGSAALYLLQPIIQFHETINKSLNWSLIAGIIWAASFLLLIHSIDRIGLSRSNQWKNLQGPIGVILSLIILSEYLTTNALFAVLAGIAVFVSAVFFSATTENQKSNQTGILFAVLSAIGFGIVTVINKYVTDNVGVYSQQVVWSLSIFISMFVYAIVKGGLFRDIWQISRRDVALGIMAGLLYLGASFFMLESYRYIDASVGFTIIQLNALWTIGIGILVFKEISIRREMVKIMGGIFFAVTGIFLLFLTKI